MVYLLLYCVWMEETDGMEEIPIERDGFARMAHLFFCSLCRKITYAEIS